MQCFESINKHHNVIRLDEADNQEIVNLEQEILVSSLFITEG